MYVLLERPGQPPERIKVDGEEVVIGRAPNCDVVIEEEFISKQHLRILSGLVAVDVSSNGTFLDGKRIHGGVVPGGRPLQLADSDITLRIEADELAPAKSPAPVPVSAPPAAPVASQEDALAGKRTAILQDQLQDAAKRLEAKAARCRELESEAKASADAAAEAAKETASLREAAAGLHKQIAELESKAAEPTPPTDGSAAGLLLFSVQRENAQLKKAMAEHKANAAAEAAKLAAAQSDVAKQLAAAKAAVRERAAEVSAAPPPATPIAPQPAAPPSAAPPPVVPPPGTPQPAAAQAAPAAPAQPTVAPTPIPGKVALPFGDPVEPATKLPGAGLPGSGLPGAGLPGAGSPGGGLPGSGAAADLPDAVQPMDAASDTGAIAGGDLNTSRLMELLQKDAEAMTVRPDDPLDAFLLVEGFRFLRRMERVVTRLAGGFIQLYQQQTMVPGVGGNLRQLLGEVAQNPGKPHTRAELLNYLKELGRWLVVALSAYRKAAVGIANQIKDDLSADALTASDPISIVKRATGKGEAELWRRVCEHMKTLSTDEITERVEKLAREAADDLTDGDLPDDAEGSEFG